MKKEKVIFSALLWKFLERFGVQVSQFILQVILARLLDPEHYGVLSMMVIFTTLANVFIQRGFNTALIQNKEVTEEDYSSVFWVTMGVATTIYALLFFSAPLIADFYNMPDLTQPFRALCLMLFPGALNSIQLAKVSRAMDFKKVFRSNVAAIFVSSIIGIAMAAAGAGLWALVAQHVANVVVACMVMWFTVRWRPRLVCNMARVKVLFSYGWKLLVSGLLDTLYQDLRSLVIGKKYDSGTLGYYNRGKQFPQFIINAVNTTVQSVMLPALSAEQDDKQRVKTMMRNSIMLSSFIIFPIMAGLAAVAEPLVLVLLTEKWLPCVPYLQIYCASLVLYPVNSCNLQAINAVGRSDTFLKLEIIKKVYGVTLLVAAVVFFDTPIAIALTGVLTAWIGWFVNASPNKKLVNYSYFEQIQDVLPTLLISGLMFGCTWAVTFLNIAPILQIAIQVAVGVAVYILLATITRNKAYHMILTMLKGLFKKKGKSQNAD